MPEASGFLVPDRHCGVLWEPEYRMTAGFSVRISSGIGVDDLPEII